MNFDRHLAIDPTRDDCWLVLLSDNRPNYDYARFLIDRGNIPAAAHALRIANRMTDDDATIMRRLTQLSEWAVDGQIWVYEWGRDCDLAESDRCYQIPATLEALDAAYEHMWDNAEGPCSLYPVSPEFAAGFTRTFRDLAAEMMGY